MQVCHGILVWISVRQVRERQRASACVLARLYSDRLLARVAVVISIDREGNFYPVDVGREVHAEIVCQDGGARLERRRIALYPDHPVVVIPEFSHEQLGLPWPGLDTAAGVLDGGLPVDRAIRVAR